MSRPRLAAALAPSVVPAAGLVAVALGLLAAPSPGQCQLAELVPPGLAITHELGLRENSVALSGDLLAIGDPGDDQAHEDAGSVTVYRREAGVWVFDAQLFASDPRPIDSFGHSVELQGDRLLVGAPQKDVVPDPEAEGAVYEFRRVGGQWVELGLILPPDPASVELYGWTMDLDGDQLAVGDIFSFSPSGGSLHLFRLEDGAWEFEQRIAPELEGISSFGIDVDLEGDRLVVGDSQDGEAGFEAGAAYIYERGPDGWKQVTKLRPTPGDYTRFGISVSLQGDTVAVGAPLLEVDGDLSGGLFVFEKNGPLWQPSPLFDAPVPAKFDQLGFSTAFADGLILVGHPGQDDGAPGSGAVHAFRPEDGAPGWRFAGTLKAGDPGNTDRLGHSIATDGDVVAVSSPFHDGGVAGSGALFVFGGIPGSPIWSVAEGSVGSGDAACVFGAGPLAAGGPVTLTLVDAPPGTAATLVLGGGVLGQPFQGGVLVPSPEVLIAPLLVGPEGVLELAGTWPAGTPSGFELVAQLWWVDGGAPSGFAASDGVIGTVP